MEGREREEMFLETQNRGKNKGGKKRKGKRGVTGKYWARQRRSGLGSSSL